jgi:hypothetical protein
MNLCRDVLGKQARAGRVAPTPIKSDAEQQDVEPVDQERSAEVNELGQRDGRKRGQRDGAEKGKM